MNVLDALVVTLSLDATNFVKNQKAAEAAMTDAQKKAKKEADEIERAAKKAAEATSKVQNGLLALFAVLTAGRGLKEFIADVSATDNALGRLADNLKTTPSTISAFQGAVERIGGSAQGTAASFQSFSDRIQELKATGNTSILPFLYRLQAAGGTQINLNKSLDATFLDLADNLHAIAARDPAQANWFGRQLGLDPNTVNLLMQGRKAVEAQIAEQKRLGVVSREDAEAGMKLVNAFGALKAASTSLGRTLLTFATPMMVKLSEALTNLAVWARQHGPFLEALFVGLAAAATALGIAIAAPYAEIMLLVAGIGLAVTAIALLYDDWRTWLAGGKSEFGGFYQYVADRWHAVETVFEEVFSRIKALFGDMVAVARDELGLISAVFFGTGDDIRGAFGKLFGDLRRYFNDFVSFIKSLGPAIFAAMRTAFLSAFGWVEGRLNAILSALHLPTINLGLGDGGAAPDGGGGTGSPLGGNDAIRRRGRGTRGSVPDGPLPKNGWWTPERQKHAYDRLVAAGMSSEGAIGLISRWKNVESNGGPTSLNPFSGAYGIIQGLGKRKPKSANFDDQLDNVIREYKTGSGDGAGPKASRLLRSAQTPQQGATAASSYERAEGYDPSTGNDAFTARTLKGMDEVRRNVTGTGGAARKALAPIPSARPFGDLSGAARAFGRGGVSNDNRHTSNQSISVGQVTVHTQATDAKGIARDIGGAIDKYSFATQSNYGLR